ncbi:MAG: serine/threonine protein kinase [Deltaproteobacteria bacterium]|nr:serine/threonine protein kinase [Deltaproteobacteria bacterium]
MGLALAGGRAFLPLIAAPADAGTHIVEIYTPESKDPLVLFARPMGPPTSVGFPLQLKPFDPTSTPWPERRSIRRDLDDPILVEEDDDDDAAAGVLRPKSPTNHALTPRHTADLGGGPAGGASPEGLLSRALAGGKLVIERLLGSGGVGSVFMASHRDLRIRVAVKVLHERFQSDIEFCRRFHAEGLSASRLDHQNLVRVLDFGQEPDGLLYLAMEYIDGTCLADVIGDRRPLSLERIVDLMQQVCAGLAHAHTRGVVHRDIKPENVMLVTNHDDDERPHELVKVCDFGIAVQARDAQSKMVIGTPDYMSPEQCRAEPLDGRSDVYSLGVMLYELATGDMPFVGATPRALVEAHVGTAPRPPSTLNPGIDKGLERIIMKALEKRPQDRQQSMRQLRTELRSLIPSTGASPRPPSLAPPSSRVPEISTQPSTRPSLGAMPAVREDTSDWLERGSPSYAPDSSRSGAVRLERGRVVAAEVSARPAQWLAPLARATAEEDFRARAAQLEEALPEILTERNLKTLFAIHSTLDVLAADDPSAPGWKIAGARRLQHVLFDATFVGWLAEAALAEDEPSREVVRLLVGAGAPATYALYSARLRLTEQANVRARFVRRLRDFGVASLPMIRAGLARLEPKRGMLVAASLAQDLFEASPRVRDDEAGFSAAAYLRDSNAELTAAAARAIAAFWGARALPLLVGLLESEDPIVLVAALDGLRETRAVDMHVARRIRALASSSPHPEVQRAGRAALEA